ncbi:MAG: FecR domain-containing protein [Acidobacteriia bacterium]|nr:FecR domain-containing protein [Terriglobia bacterium]
MRQLCTLLGMTALLAGAAMAQEVVSVKAGLISYPEGEVFLDGKPIDRPTPGKGFNQFADMKANAVLKTGYGRVEVLLAPGIFLRMGEDSSIRMISNKLEDTKLELLSGSVVLEAAEILKENSISIRYGQATVIPVKNGLYRIDSQPAELRVFEGRAEVVSGDKKLLARKSALVPLSGDLVAGKFDTDDTDPLDRWSARRAGYTAMANVSATKSLRDSGMGWNRSGWMWNPYFGMYTFIPVNGGIYSPYGYAYYNPRTIYSVYEPRNSYSSGGGNGGGYSGSRYDSNLGYSVSSGRSYGGYAPSGGGASGAPAAAAAPAPRAAESAAPRGGEGGGRGK